MAWYFVVLIVLGAFLFMEFVAWFTHKYVMHGFLWVLHKDHHHRDGRKWEWSISNLPLEDSSPIFCDQNNMIPILSNTMTKFM